MKIEKTKQFIKQKEKLIKKSSLSKEQIDKTIEILKNNPQDHRLRPHKIFCKRDKRRKSLTIPNTQYRILYSDYGEFAIFLQILKHDEYDRANKDC